MTNTAIMTKELSPVEEANNIIEEVISSLITEAVRHFELSRPRSYEDDARYFYKKEELDTFWSLFSGNPKNLICNTILDDNGGFYCYEICRVHRDNRV